MQAMARVAVLLPAPRAPLPPVVHRRCQGAHPQPQQHLEQQQHVRQRRHQRQQLAVCRAAGAAEAAAPLPDDAGQPAAAAAAAPPKKGWAAQLTPLSDPAANHKLLALSTGEGLRDGTKSMPCSPVPLVPLPLLC